MVQRMEIVLEDDIDGTEATGTVTFGLEGISYEIDLSDENAAKLREALAPFVSFARRVGGRRIPERKRSASGNGSDATAIRAWAKKQGIAVNDRGRVPSDLRKQYEEAH